MGGQWETRCQVPASKTAAQHMWLRLPHAGRARCEITATLLTHSPPASGPLAWRGHGSTVASLRRLCGQPSTSRLRTVMKIQWAIGLLTCLPAIEVAHCADSDVARTRIAVAAFLDVAPEKVQWRLLGRPDDGPDNWFHPISVQVPDPPAAPFRDDSHIITIKVNARDYYVQDVTWRANRPPWSPKCPEQSSVDQCEPIAERYARGKLRPWPHDMRLSYKGVMFGGPGAGPGQPALRCGLVRPPRRGGRTTWGLFVPRPPVSCSRAMPGRSLRLHVVQSRLPGLRPGFIWGP
jgi:hypothetical protein